MRPTTTIATSNAITATNSSISNEFGRVFRFLWKRFALIGRCRKGRWRPDIDLSGGNYRLFKLLMNHRLLPLLLSPQQRGEKSRKEAIFAQDV